jgi:hypothetical protein
LSADTLKPARAATAAAGASPEPTATEVAARRGDQLMPHLSADALETDPEGMEFLRDVLGSGRKAGSESEAVDPTTVEVEAPARRPAPPPAGFHEPLKLPAVAAAVIFRPKATAA